MLKSRLGFGMMRLPVKNGDPTDFDYEQLNAMVDTFMEAGYTYFDTSYVYHNGKSEEAVRIGAFLEENGIPRLDWKDSD